MASSNHGNGGNHDPDHDHDNDNGHGNSDHDHDARARLIADTKVPKGGSSALLAAGRSVPSVKYRWHHACR
jgi:hypothetical protein